MSESQSRGKHKLLACFIKSPDDSKFNYEPQDEWLILYLSSSAKWPFSAILSASSTTKYLSECKFCKYSCPVCLNSQNLPGVATIISGRILVRIRCCFSAAMPPTMAVVLTEVNFEMSRMLSWTCIANSRVGQRIRAWGPTVFSSLKSRYSSKDGFSSISVFASGWSLYFSIKKLMYESSHFYSFTYPNIQ